jgi:hypothetical protein
MKALGITGFQIVVIFKKADAEIFSTLNRSLTDKKESEPKGSLFYLLDDNLMTFGGAIVGNHKGIGARR